MNPDEVICIIDRSGSMESIASDAIGGFNSFLTGQKKADSEGLMTLVLFNEQHEIIHHSQPLAEIPPLDEQSYLPRGTTALYDAVGTTLTSAMKAYKEKADSAKPSGVTVSILTDGYENASQAFSREQVAALISQAQSDLGWQFVFLAANQDAVLSAQSISIQANDAAHFVASPEGTISAFTDLNYMAYERRSHQKSKKS